MKLTDQIEQIILEKLTASGGMAQIRRNELANLIGCVPSQINYVIRTRFGGENGYLVESHRGGGGYIVIRQIRFSNEVIPYMIQHSGPQMTQQSVHICLDQLYKQNALSYRECALIKAATSASCLPETQPPKTLERAKRFKLMLATLDTLS